MQTPVSKIHNLIRKIGLRMYGNNVRIDTSVARAPAPSPPHTGTVASNALIVEDEGIVPNRSTTAV